MQVTRQHFCSGCVFISESFPYSILGLKNKQSSLSFQKIPEGRPPSFQPFPTFSSCLENLKFSSSISLESFKSTPFKVAIWGDSLFGSRRGRRQLLVMLLCYAKNNSRTTKVEKVHLQNFNPLLESRKLFLDIFPEQFIHST